MNEAGKGAYWAIDPNVSLEEGSTNSRKHRSNRATSDPMPYSPNGIGSVGGGSSGSGSAGSHGSNYHSRNRQDSNGSQNGMYLTTNYQQYSKQSPLSGTFSSSPNPSHMANIPSTPIITTPYGTIEQYQSPIQSAQSSRHPSFSSGSGGRPSFLVAPSTYHQPHSPTSPGLLRPGSFLSTPTSPGYYSQHSAGPGSPSPSSFYHSTSPSRRVSSLGIPQNSVPNSYSELMVGGNNNVPFSISTSSNNGFTYDVVRSSSMSDGTSPTIGGQTSANSGGGGGYLSPNFYAGGTKKNISQSSGVTGVDNNYVYSVPHSPMPGSSHVNFDSFDESGNNNFYSHSSNSQNTWNSS